MARSRNIKPGLAKNEVLAELGPHAQLLFAMLPCFADREGRLEDRPKRLKAEIFPYYDVDVDVLLSALADCSERFIERYEVDGSAYIQITNFHLHQSPHAREAETEIPAPDKASPRQCVNPDKPDLGVKVKGISKEVKGISNKAVEHFNEWWDVVHLKKAKADAEKAYHNAVKRIRREHPDLDAHAFLLERMMLFALSPEADPPDRSPIHPATWLNKGRYEDDPATWNRQRGQPNGQRAPSNSERILELLNQ